MESILNASSEQPASSSQAGELPFSDYQQMEDNNNKNNSRRTNEKPVDETTLQTYEKVIDKYEGNAADDEEEEYDLVNQRKRASRLFWVQAAYISVGAIFGVLFRMIIAQLFGEECANPGTVGWLSSGAPLCVTADGEASQSGGVIFSDLPANMFGCFLMGMWASGEFLHLALPLPLAWLKPGHPFQSMDILHTAFKTGFCGSLTTFSSWNSAMVVLIFGTGSNLHTQIWLALLGYIVGMETAQGSYVAGKSLARFIHGYVNPSLVEEAHLLQEKEAEGIYIHRELPDYERRVLLDLNMEPLAESDEIVPVNALDTLVRWRESTSSARRLHHPLLPSLLEIEKAAMVLNMPISRSAQAIARSEGWDIDALHRWVDEKALMCSHTGLNTWNKVFVQRTLHSRWLTLPVAAFILWSLIFGLVMCVIFLSSDEAIIVTYRTMAFAMLVAPFGAVLRWRLGALNGVLTSYSWFPFGTYTANVFGSIVSITCVALEYHLEKNRMTNYFWTIGSIRVIRIGFAGCLTTVSTFAAEANNFIHFKTNHAYPYILTTIVSACIPSVIIYAILVYAL